MVTKNDCKRIGDYVWEVPCTFRHDMRVPARIYANEDILEAASKDRGLEQLVNTTTLPGVARYTLAMPDIHQGYGPPIGAVVPIRAADGVISPGAVGYDINCGVRLLRSQVHADEIRSHMDDLVNALFLAVPSGVGRGGNIRLSDREMETVLNEGARWAIGQGFGTQDDLEHTEERGSMPGADASVVSASAMARGRDQVGTLGSGNHFAEIGRIETVYDDAVARQFGLWEGQVVVWIHTGSRGLGHQVCTDYVKQLQKAVRDYGIVLPDRELVCAPFASPEGRQYYSAMAAAANFAWANRQVLTHRVRTAFESVLRGTVKHLDLTLLYDVAHNIVKRELYDVDGAPTELIVHRKGATRAFGPGRPEVPRDYRPIGQPVLVPGDMGTASYILVGTDTAMRESFGSCCHGAGRAMSRSAALQKERGQQVQARLRDEGIVVRSESMKGLAEEAPEAYKDVNLVVEVVHRAGIARKVARTVPLGVIKG